MTTSRVKTTDAHMDSPLLGVVESIPRCAALLRLWADKLETKHNQFCALQEDLGALLAHTEHLSLELEESRPDAPVYKNAETALKKAVSRTAKVLKDMQVNLEALKGELSPPSQYGTVFDNSEKSLNECSDYAAAYREGCLSYEATGESIASEKKEKKKKTEKDRKRSNSPKRSREKNASLMA